MNHDNETTDTDTPFDASPFDSGTATTIVLVDPTSADGEMALNTLTDDDHDVAVVVLLSGRSSSALRDYARGEGVHLSTAAWNYLDSLTPRYMHRLRRIEHVVANGPDPAFELGNIASQRDVARIALPESAVRLDATLIERLERLTTAPIQIAEYATR